MYAPGEKPIWASGTSGPVQNFLHIHLVVQGDGNLVLYNPFNAGNNERPIWDSKTFGKDTKPILMMQDDGNLVLYGSKFAGDLLWASNST